MVTKQHLGILRIEIGRTDLAFGLTHGGLGISAPRRRLFLLVHASGDRRRSEAVDFRRHRRREFVQSLTEIGQCGTRDGQRLAGPDRRLVLREPLLEVSVDQTQSDAARFQESSDRLVRLDHDDFEVDDPAGQILSPIVEFAKRASPRRQFAQLLQLLLSEVDRGDEGGQ